MTEHQLKELAKELEGALADINAVRSDLRTTSGISPNVRGPFSSLLERAAVHVEGVRVALRTA